MILPITNVDVIGDVIGDVMWSRNRLYILLTATNRHTDTVVIPRTSTVGEVGPMKTQTNTHCYQPQPPFRQIDITGAVVIVWRVRGKTIRSVLCNIVCNNCAQCDAHTYEQTNSSLDWVLSQWAHFTVLRFIFVLCITVCCMHA